MENKVLQVSCPHCAKQFNYYSSESRPFCSKRCKMVDLGSWLDESYRVPVKTIDPLDEQISSGEPEEEENE